MLEVADVPAPIARPGHLLIQTHASLISAGTERMLVEFGKASLLAKARSQPDKVKQVMDKIKTDGLLPTLETVFNRLDEPLPLGYCNAGLVLEVGRGITGFAPGDRVVSNGPHAEIVCVPKNLCAKIPDGVSDEQAAFTVLSSIALQGIRLTQPALGETIAVVGLGLIGLVCAQLLRANGCHVIGSDVDKQRLELAEKFGCQTVNVGAGADLVAAAMAATNGRGVDAVVITAASKSDEIIHQAAEACRKRGRIILVGTTGLNIRRDDFYAKELSFQVSCSYGPGRYDEAYEQGGQDYPLGFVRWTEQRNFEAILSAMQDGKLNTQDLVTHRFEQAHAGPAYDTVTNDRRALGVILNYPQQVNTSTKTVLVVPAELAKPATNCEVGVIGAGNFSKMTLMPALSKTSARIAYIADLNGASAFHLARKHGVENAITDYQVILKDPKVQAVFIAVGHSLHSHLVCEVLDAGKHAFVEKPLAMNAQELTSIFEASARHPDRHIMVGFNRRFSPHLQKMKSLLAGRSEPLCMNMTVNAGFVPPEHWVQDPIRGGGRIVGEGCHFIDLLMYLAASPVKTVSAAMVGGGVATRGDKMSIVLTFEDGSIGTVNYFANGSKSYPKETLEVFSDARVLKLDNFRLLKGFGFKGFSKFKTFRQDKGHGVEFGAFVEKVVSGGEPLIPLKQLANVTLASFAAVTSAAERRTIELAREYPSFA